jgi:hypothetical protein
LSSRSIGVQAIPSFKANRYSRIGIWTRIECRRPGRIFSDLIGRSAEFSLDVFPARADRDKSRRKKILRAAASLDHGDGLCPCVAVALRLILPLALGPAIEGSLDPRAPLALSPGPAQLARLLALGPRVSCDRPQASLSCRSPGTSDRKAKTKKKEPAAATRAIGRPSAPAPDWESVWRSRPGSSVF